MQYVEHQVRLQKEPCKVFPSFFADFKFFSYRLN